jgi:acetyl esterase/lipase
LKPIYIFLFTSMLFTLRAVAQTDTVISKNIVYAEAGNRKLLLDIYKLSSKKDPYLIVWVHGGAWRSGSKESPPLGMLQEGYAIASLDFRLSTEAPFPAQVHDIKAAIRFLRAHAAQYGYRHDSVIIWGSSSGGHLVALAGTTNNDPYMEGTLGNDRNESSSVQAVIDFYGPANLLTILTQSTPHGISVRAPALELLLGKPVEQVPELAKKASPVYQVDPTDPPMLIVHGDQDIQVPVNQSLELMAAYKKNKLTVQLEIIPGAGHGDTVYYKHDVQYIMAAFLKNVFKK